jgi:hypothetical protein
MMKTAFNIELKKENEKQEDELENIISTIIQSNKLEDKETKSKDSKLLQEEQTDVVTKVKDTDYKLKELSIQESRPVEMKLAKDGKAETVQKVTKAEEPLPKIQPIKVDETQPQDLQISEPKLETVDKIDTNEVKIQETKSIDSKLLQEEQTDVVTKVKDTDYKLKELSIQESRPVEMKLAKDGKAETVQKVTKAEEPLPKIQPIKVDETQPQDLQISEPKLETVDKIDTNEVKIQETKSIDSKLLQEEQTDVVTKVKDTDYKLKELSIQESRPVEMKLAKDGKAETVQKVTKAEEPLPKIQPIKVDETQPQDLQISEPKLETVDKIDTNEVKIQETKSIDSKLLQEEQTDVVTKVKDTDYKLKELSIQESRPVEMKLAKDGKAETVQKVTKAEEPLPKIQPIKVDETQPQDLQISEPKLETVDKIDTNEVKIQETKSIDSKLLQEEQTDVVTKVKDTDYKLKELSIQESRPVEMKLAKDGKAETVQKVTKAEEPLPKIQPIKVDETQPQDLQISEPKLETVDKIDTNEVKIQETKSIDSKLLQEEQTDVVTKVKDTDYKLKELSIQESRPVEMKLAKDGKAETVQKVTKAEEPLPKIQPIKVDETQPQDLQISEPKLETVDKIDTNEVKIQETKSIDSKLLQEEQTDVVTKVKDTDYKLKELSIQESRPVEMKLAKDGKAETVQKVTKAEEPLPKIQPIKVDETQPQDLQISEPKLETVDKIDTNEVKIQETKSIDSKLLQEEQTDVVTKVKDTDYKLKELSIQESRPVEMKLAKDGKAETVQKVTKAEEPLPKIQPIKVDETQPQDLQISEPKLETVDKIDTNEVKIQETKSIDSKLLQEEQTDVVTKVKDTDYKLKELSIQESRPVEMKLAKDGKAETVQKVTKAEEPLPKIQPIKVDETQPQDLQISEPKLETVDKIDTNEVKIQETKSIDSKLLQEEQTDVVTKVKDTDYKLKELSIQESRPVEMKLAKDGKAETVQKVTKAEEPLPKIQPIKVDETQPQDLQISEPKLETVDKIDTNEVKIQETKSIDSKLLQEEQTDVVTKVKDTDYKLKELSIQESRPVEMKLAKDGKAETVQKVTKAEEPLPKIQPIKVDETQPQDLQISEPKLETVDKIDTNEVKIQETKSIDSKLLQEEQTDVVTKVKDTDYKLKELSIQESRPVEMKLAKDGKAETVQKVTKAEEPLPKIQPIKVDETQPQDLQISEPKLETVDKIDTNEVKIQETKSIDSKLLQEEQTDVVTKVKDTDYKLKELSIQESRPVEMKLAKDGKAETVQKVTKAEEPLPKIQPIKVDETQPQDLQISEPKLETVDNTNEVKIQESKSTVEKAELSKLNQIL